MLYCKLKGGISMLLLTILLILWPFLFPAGCAAAFALDGNGGTPLILFSVFYTVLSAVLHHRYRICSKASDIPLQKLAKHNLLIKLLTALCDTAVYAPFIASYIEAQIAIADGAMMCVPYFLLCFIVLTPYNLSRIFTLVTTMRISHYLLKEFYWQTQQNMLHRSVWVHTVLLFLPVCHIVSNILVYRKLRSLPAEHTEQ